MSVCVACQHPPPILKGSLGQGGQWPEMSSQHVVAGLLPGLPGSLLPTVLADLLMNNPGLDGFNAPG